MKKSIFALFVSLAPIMAQESKLAPDLAGVGAQEMVDVIIQLEEADARMDEGRRGAQRPLPRALSGSARVSRLTAFPGVIARVSGSALATLAQDSQVRYISPDREVTGSGEGRGFKSPRNANVPTVNANLAHSAGFRGAGIGVAVLDSGISDIAAFRTNSCQVVSRLKMQETFVPGDTPTPRPHDPYGHGTHVAGIIGDTQCNAENKMYDHSIGVAPEADLISFRVLDDSGRGLDSSVIRAIDRAIALRATHNIRVMNLSLGRRALVSKLAGNRLGLN